MKSFCKISLAGITLLSLNFVFVNMPVAIASDKDKLDDLYSDNDQSILVEDVGVLGAFAGISDDKIEAYENACTNSEHVMDKACMAALAKKIASKLKDAHTPVTAYTCYPHPDEPGGANDNSALFMRDKQLVYRDASTLGNYILGNFSGNHVNSRVFSMAANRSSDLGKQISIFPLKNGDLKVALNANSSTICSPVNEGFSRFIGSKKTGD
jgi:hypothetical protein